MHYACKNDYFGLFSWSSLHLANVNSAGTHHCGRAEVTAFFVSDSNLVGGPTPSSPFAILCYFTKRPVASYIFSPRRMKI